MKALVSLIIAFPLAGAVFLAVFGRHTARKTAGWVACGAVACSFLCAAAAFVSGGGQSVGVTFFEWFGVDAFRVAADALYNPLSAIMALMVTFVSSLIHLYSVGYMREDEDYARYFCYLNLFVFSMLVITLADNIVFLFVGWEGVGFCSYALIGFWYSDVKNATAGRKAFILTRIGDVAFGVAIGLFFAQFGSTSISFINAHAGELTAGAATAFGLLLLWSAAGKSAQLPLVVWLPDAMAGPTPVSALIHAATMVTAGVYLLMRLYPVVSLSPTAMAAIAAAGTVTAIYAACSALAQRDIKRVLAYSTISQLGYMFLALGAGDLIGSMSFLLSHAFYKSLLFLCAGCVIQALHEEHDIFRMGGLRRRMPEVFWLFLAGALSLGAIPGTGGFLNKDHILMAVLSRAGWVYELCWYAAMAAVFLTSLYAFRLFFAVFLRRPEPGPAREVLPLPAVMTRVLWPLALLALAGGYLNLPALWGGGEWLSSFLAGVPGAAAHAGAAEALEWRIAAEDGALAVLALLVAFVLYGPTELLGLRKVVDAFHDVRDFFLSGFYLDALYRAAIVRPYQSLAGVLWLAVDEGGVDHGIVGMGKTFPEVGAELRRWTTGRLSTYLGMLFLGLVLLLCALAAGLYAGM